jgi:membrane carboxypeptidase/penicillin-binding protein PbpC
LYLNEIEWGDGIYGAEAAARTYFGTSASAVSPDQAALMAGAIVNPRELSIWHPNGRLRNRQRIIRARMGNVTPPPVVVSPVEPALTPEVPPENTPETAPQPISPVLPVSPIDVQPQAEPPSGREPAPEPQTPAPAPQP